VVADEARLLETNGHEVVRYTAHNDQVSSLSKLTLAQQTIWNQHVHSDLRRLISRHRPHVLHAHNTLPLLSPSVYYAGQRRRSAGRANAAQLSPDVSCGRLLPREATYAPTVWGSRSHGTQLFMPATAAAVLPVPRS
jgi:hypothetical protein